MGSNSEMACYEACYRPHIKAQNARNKKGRHPERNLSLKQYYEMHPPEETLLYLGNMDNHVSEDVLWAVFEDYREWLVNECHDDDKGCGVELLNAALHMDEATPHIQYRQMYYATDRYGDFVVSQNKVLAGLGYNRPDPTCDVDRKNNAKVTFTAVCRAKMIEIAKSHGVELIEEPLPREESGKTLEEYKAREQMKAERAEMEQKIRVEKENAEQELAAHEQAIENAYDELEKAIEKSKAEIKQNEEIKRDQRQETDDMKGYIAHKRKKADEQAEQEAREEREKCERLAQELCEKAKQAVTAEKIVSRGNPQKAAEEENERENVQNASETSETVKAIPDTLKTQTPLKNAYSAYDENGEVSEEPKQLLERIMRQRPKPDEPDEPDEPDKSDDSGLEF